MKIPPSLTLCRPEIPKQLILQTSKCQMKCAISSGSTLFAKTYSIFREIKSMLFGNYNPLIYIMDHPHLPIGILGRVWYLIVSTPDLCTLTYFVYSFMENPIGNTIKYIWCIIQLNGNLTSDCVWLAKCWPDRFYIQSIWSTVYVLYLIVELFSVVLMHIYMFILAILCYAICEVWYGKANRLNVTPWITTKQPPI